MEKQWKPKVVEAHPGKEEKESLIWFEKGRRTKHADYHRIENNPEQEVLTPFELEVKEELASVPSPYDELARIESEDELAMNEYKRNAKLGHLAHKAKLSPLQRACYQLVYMDRISEEKVLERLGVSRARLWSLKKSVEIAILRAHQKEKSRETLSKKRRLSGQSLTPYQKSIIELHENQRLSFAEIAKRYGVLKSTIANIYRRVQKNIF